MSFNPSPQELQQIASSIGADDADVLAAELKLIFENYETRRAHSRDAHPTAAEALASGLEIEKRLAWVVEELLGDDKAPWFLAEWLSGAMDPDGKPLRFAEEVINLLNVVRRVNSEFIDNRDKPLEINGEAHHRRTRTRTRDQYLIPALILDATAHGDLRGHTPEWISHDLEALDKVCEFVTLCLGAANIDAPGAGDTLRAGESAQGRLRRLIKETARTLPPLKTVFDK